MAKLTGRERGYAPTNTEAADYRHYLEREAFKSRGGKGKGFYKPPRTDEQKKWDQWEKDSHVDQLDEYQAYKNQGGGRRIDDPRELKWQDFEKQTFGSRLDSFGGSGEGGKYTVQDLYIKISDKRFKDKQRDLMIDPNKKGSGRKGGSRRTGGQTGGPGNPNTGGAGAGDANL